MMSVTPLTDINRTDVYPASITALSASAVFITNDDGGGQDLWKSDGTAAGTTFLESLESPGTLGPSPDLTTTPGGVYLFKSDPSGAVLQRVDAATGLVSTIERFASSNGTTEVPGAILPSGSGVFFTAAISQSAVTSTLLYASDGTTSGTRVAATLADDPAVITPEQVAKVGSSFLFFGTIGTTKGLYSSDGTAVGTRLVSPFSSSAEADHFTTVGGHALFVVDNPAATPGANVYATDGTPAGTNVLVAGLTMNDSPVVFRNVAYFSGTLDGVSSLWASDGTVGGTRPIAGFATLDDLVATSSSLFFTSVVGGSAVLYASDGTAPGTRSLGTVDFAETSQSTAEGRLTALGAKVFFPAYDPSHGTELWSSDGTAQGTGLVADLLPGPVGSEPTNLAAVGSRLFFAAHDTGMNELWASDGTASGTRSLGGVSTSPSTATALMGPSATTSSDDLADVPRVQLGSLVVFEADDGEHGMEPWVTDGTSSGTVLLKDIDPGPASSDISDLTVAGSELFFEADDGIHGRELWVTDGTRSGTHLVDDINPGAASAFPNNPSFPDLIAPSYSGTSSVGSTVYFGANDGTSGVDQLWRSDGTAAGTALVASLPAVATVSFEPSISQVTAVGSEVFFLRASSTAPTAEDLWKTDGTPANTSQVPLGPGVTLGDLVSFGGSLFFLEGTPSGDSSLWKTDGTASGTVLVYGVNRPFSSLRVAGSRLFFTDGHRVYSSDGTTAGTTVVSGDDSTDVGDTLVTAGGLVDFVTGAVGGLGGTLNRSDGTVGGTFAVSGDPVESPLVSLGGSVFYASYSATSPGFALVEYDGIGTVSEVFASGIVLKFGSAPAIVPISRRQDGDIIAFANDGQVGAELQDIGPGLNVVNQAPIFAAIPEQALLAGTTLTFPATAFDPDDEQALTYSLGPNSPSGAAVDPASGVLNWPVPASLAAGTYTVTVVARDDGSPPKTAMTAVSFLVAAQGSEHDPVIDPIPSQTIAAGQTLTIPVVATALDAGHSLTYSLQANVDGASIDPASGVIRFVAPPADAGQTVSITVVATNDEAVPLSSSSSVSIQVRPADSAPILTSTFGEQDVAAGTNLGLTFSATDPDPGQTIVFTLGSDAPSGASIDPATGVFSWTPSASQAPASYAITVIATDDFSTPLSTTTTLDVLVAVSPPVNHAPVLSPIADQSVVVGQTLRFTTEATDPDPGQVLTFALVAPGLAGATIDPATGAITFDSRATSPGVYSATVVATDDGSPPLADSKAVRITVLAIHDTPAIDAIADQSVNEGLILTLTAHGHDADASRTLTYSLDPGAPLGASIGAVSGVFSYAPPFGPAGGQVTIRVSDDDTPSFSATTTFHVVAIDVPPLVVAGTSDFLVAGGALLRSGSFADPGKQSWTATVDYGDGSGIAPLTLNAGKTLSLSHVYAAAGSYLAEVVVTDSGGQAGTATFPVIVASVVAPPAPQPGIFGLSSISAQVSERVGSVSFTVVRSSGTDGEASVGYSTADGSAVAGSDYLATSGVLSFGPGEASKTITIPILDANLFSGRKTLSLSLLDPTGGATIGPSSTATATILDDDPAPPLITVVSISPVVSGKKRTKAVTGFRIVLTGPLNVATALSPSIFALSRIVKKGRKRVNQGITIASVTYDGRTGITLSLARKLSLTGQGQLTIDGNRLPDRTGRGLDGNHDGTPGGTLISSVIKTGSVSIRSLIPRLP